MLRHTSRADVFIKSSIEKTYLPVEPEVKTIKAALRKSTAGGMYSSRLVLLNWSMSEEVTAITVGTCKRTNRSTSPVVVRTMDAIVLSRISRRQSSGNSGSSATLAPPALSVASPDTVYHIDLGKHAGTMTSGPTPKELR